MIAEHTQTTRARPRLWNKLSLQNLMRRVADLNVSIAEIVLCLIFAASVWAYKWITDDGYIYLAYIQNFTENGWGPVLNSGERVEGFTSPLWFAILSLANLVRPEGLLDLRQVTILLSVLLSVAATVAWIRIETIASGVDNGRNAAPRDAMAAEGRGAAFRRRFLSRQSRLNIPLAFTALWYPLQSFGTSGLETPLQSAALMVVIYYVWSGTSCSWGVGTIAGLLPIIRPELGILSVLLLCWHCLGDRRLRSALTSLATFAAPLIAVLIMRVMYYGQLLPNTYYAKTNDRFGVPAGLGYLRDTVIAYGLHWVVTAAFLLILIPLIGKPIKNVGPTTVRRAWFLTASGAITCYVVFLGGDFMHARFLLAPVVLLMAVFAGFGTDTLERFTSSLNSRIKTAAIVTIAIVLTTNYGTSIQRSMTSADDEQGATYLAISDEELAYSKLNPELSRWKTTAQPWSPTGDNYRDLSRLLGTEIGVAARAIGQLTYSGQQENGNVYVYDQLALTRPDVARLDMGRQVGRVGHAKIAPDVLIAANPRVDFYGGARTAPYFEGWVEAATISFEGSDLVLKNLDLLEPLVAQRVMTSDEASKLRAWILDKLRGPRVDRNFVTFLSMNYHRNDGVLTRVRQLADLDRSSAWRKWLQDTEGARSLLNPDGCPSLSVFGCFRRAIARQEVAAIPTLANKPDWVKITRS